MKSVFIWFLFAQIGIIEPDIRTDFHSQKITETYLGNLQMDNQWNLNPLVEGYVGVAETMLAEEVFWPMEKLNYFNRGKKKIEQAIDNDKDDPELRYLRLLVQLNAPRFLSYNDSIERDLIFFTNNILHSDLDLVWVKKFCSNLLNGKYISNSQQIRLNSFLLYINN